MRQLWWSGRRPASAGRLARDLWLFGLGVLVTTVPWLVYYAVRVGPASFWHHLVLIPIGMKERMLAWPWSGSRLTSLVPYVLAALLVLAVGSRIGRNRWPRAGPWILGASVLGLPLLLVLLLFFGPEWILEAAAFILLPAATGTAIAAVVERGPSTPTASCRVAVVGAFSAAIVMSLHPWTDLNHWLWVNGPAFLMLAYAWDRGVQRLAGGRAWVRPAAAVLQIAILVAALPPLTYITGPRMHLAGAPRADVPLDPWSALVLQPVVDFVNAETEPGEAVLEIPGSLIVFLTARTQAARLDYFAVVDGLLWDEEAELRHLRRRRPRWAFVTAGGLGWRQSFPRISAWFDAEFELHRRLGLTGIYRRRSGP